MDRSDRVVNPNDTGFERRRLQEGSLMAGYGRSNENWRNSSVFIFWPSAYITGAFYDRSWHHDSLERVTLRISVP